MPPGPNFSACRGLRDRSIPYSHYPCNASECCLLSGHHARYNELRGRHAFRCRLIRLCVQPPTHNGHEQMARLRLCYREIVAAWGLCRIPRIGHTILHRRDPMRRAMGMGKYFPYRSSETRYVHFIHIFLPRYYLLYPMQSSKADSQKPTIISTCKVQMTEADYILRARPRVWIPHGGM